MNTLLDESETQTESTQTAAHRLRSRMAAARLSFTWFGVQKALTLHQREQAADSFGAEGKFLSATKKLLDTSDVAFKLVTSVRSKATAYWKGVSLPYPEPGIRLIPQELVIEFDRQIVAFRQELDAAVAELERHYDYLRHAARIRLGGLFNPSDYPEFLEGLFAITHDYPSVEPPDYLQQLSPQLYQQECERVRNRFEEAVALAEQAFSEELAKLVEHLTERLSGQTDGKPKVFRDTAITNLTEFFQRFRSLNIRSNPQLDELVERAQQVVQGVQPQQLRDSLSLRNHVATQLSRVQSSLDDLLVDRPRRNILRRPS